MIVADTLAWVRWALSHHQPPYWLAHSGAQPIHTGLHYAHHYEILITRCREISNPLVSLSLADSSHHNSLYIDFCLSFSVQDTYPTRNKGANYYRTPTVVNALQDLFMYFMKEKLKKRVRHPVCLIGIMISFATWHCRLVSENVVPNWEFGSKFKLDEDCSQISKADLINLC